MPNTKNEADRQEESPKAKQYGLVLFITGATPNSLRAVANIKLICETHLKDNYCLEIVDVYKERDRAKANQIVALPLLIRKQPLPERKLIGDMSKTEKVLEALGL